MPQDRTPITVRPITARSRVTNGGRLLDADQRSKDARRHWDIFASFSAELGGDLSPHSEQVLRRLAGAAVALERMEADQVSGKDIDYAAFTRLVGLQRRLLRDLEDLKRKQKAEAQSGTALKAYLAGKGERVLAGDKL